MEPLKKVYQAEPTTTQKICREYGSHLRQIRGLKAAAISHTKGDQTSAAFSIDEATRIKAICDEAEKRTTKEYEARRASDAEARGRTSPEQRQYSGK